MGRTADALDALDHIRDLFLGRTLFHHDHHLRITLWLLVRFPPHDRWVD